MLASVSLKLCLAVRTYVRVWVRIIGEHSCFFGGGDFQEWRGHKNDLMLVGIFPKTSGCNLRRSIPFCPSMQREVYVTCLQPKIFNQVLGYTKTLKNKEDEK